MLRESLFIPRGSRKLSQTGIRHAFPILMNFNTLGLQVCEGYLLWELRHISRTYFGMLGAPMKRFQPYSET